MDINKVIQKLAEEQSDALLKAEAPIYMGYTDAEVDAIIADVYETYGSLTEEELAELFGM